jgi:K+-sensing histidine kinase KdpD
MIKSDLRQSRPKAIKMSYYAMAVLSVAVATVVAGITARLLQAEPIALLMLCAVIATARLGGIGPALLAMTLALFAFYYNLLPPTNSFGWKHDFLHISIAEVPRLVLFAITSLFVAIVVTTQRKATEARRR